MKRFIDKDSLIDAIEIGKDFITVYWNANEPGTPTSRHVKKVKSVPFKVHGHNPERFHEGGQDWRDWANKFGCHFHYLFEGPVDSIDINHILDEFHSDNEGELISPKLRNMIKENIT